MFAQELNINFIAFLKKVRYARESTEANAQCPAQANAQCPMPMSTSYGSSKGYMYY